MIVDCNTIEEFCDELNREADHLYDGCVRVRIDRSPEQDEAVSFEVAFHSTAMVVKADDGSAWLLKFSGFAGRDVISEDDKGETVYLEEGSETAESWRQLIQDTVAGRADIRHGKIEL